MRRIFIERDNVTHPSEPDANGNSYTASFEFYPFHEGATFAVYKGMLNGNISRRGEFCVVKTLVERSATDGELNHVINRATEAQRLAASFNTSIGQRAICFIVPILSRLKYISDFNALFRCFNPHDKRLSPEEFVVIEDFVEGTFQKFNSNNGSAWTAQSTSNSRTIPKLKNKTRQKKTSSYKKLCRVNSKTKMEDNMPMFEMTTLPPTTTTSTTTTTTGTHMPPTTTTITTTNDLIGPNNMAQAFGHYVWFVTRTSVVCGLEGVFSNLCYKFTTPVIHSMTSSFGTTDGGPDAIAQFFASHRCTNICNKWPVFKCNNQHQSEAINTGNGKSQINFYKFNSQMAHKPSIPDKNIFVESLDFAIEK